MLNEQKYELDLSALQKTMETIGSKWRVRVLCSVYDGNKRYTEIQRSIEGLTPRMLSKELKDCETLDLIERRVVSEKPLSVEYHITDKTASLEPIFREMVAWGLKQSN